MGRDASGGFERWAAWPRRAGRIVRFTACTAGCWFSSRRAGRHERGATKVPAEQSEVAARHPGRSANAIGADDVRGVLDELRRLQDVFGGQLDGLRRTLSGVREAFREVPEAGRPRQKTGILELYDGTEKTFTDWKLVGSGELGQGDGELRITAGPDRGLAYFAPLRFGDFRLEFQYRPEGDSDAGVAVRFLDPEQPVPDRDDPTVLYPYDNQAYVASHTGFGVLLGPLRSGSEPGTFEGVLLGDSRGAQRHAERPDVKTGDWNDIEVEVKGDKYWVRLNGKKSAHFVNTDAYRGKSSRADPRAGFLGFSIRKGRIAIRNVRLEARTQAEDARPGPGTEGSKKGWKRGPSRREPKTHA